MHVLPLVFVAMSLLAADAAPPADRLELSLWPEGVRLGMTKDELMTARPKGRTLGMTMDDAPGPRDDDVVSESTGPAGYMYWLVDGSVESLAIVPPRRAAEPVRVFDTAVRELGQPDRKLVLEKRLPGRDGGDERVEPEPVLAWDHPQLTLRLRISGSLERSALMVATSKSRPVPGLTELPYDVASHAQLFSAIEDAIERALGPQSESPSTGSPSPSK